MYRGRFVFLSELQKKMTKEKNIYDALVILFFLSKSDRCSFGLEDEVADYFSSGSRLDMFVDFCEDLKLHFGDGLLEIGEEKEFAVVSGYFAWYDKLLSEANFDERSWNKCLDQQLIFLDSYPAEKFIVQIKKLFLNPNAQTTLQRLHSVRRKVSKMLKLAQKENLCSQFTDVEI